MAVVAIAVSDILRYLAAIESRLCRLPPGTRRTRPCVLTLAGCVAYLRAKSFYGVLIKSFCPPLGHACLRLPCYMHLRMCPSSHWLAAVPLAATPAVALLVSVAAPTPGGAVAAGGARAASAAAAAHAHALGQAVLSAVQREEILVEVRGHNRIDILFFSDL